MLVWPGLDSEVTNTRFEMAVNVSSWPPLSWADNLDQIQLQEVCEFGCQ